MSDLATTVGHNLPDPDQRGSTTIAAQAVQHIAEAELGQVPGVVATGSGLDKVVGRQYPKVTADVAGSRARLSIEIAVAWPGRCRWQTCVRGSGTPCAPASPS